MIARVTRLHSLRALSARSAGVSSCFFSTTTRPVVSQGVSESQVTDELNPLLKAGWTLDESCSGIEKDFFNTIAIRSKAKNHHSVMTVKAGSVHVHWTTHHPRGLSLQDTVMARYCDEQSSSIGTVEQGQSKKCHPAPA